jgi:hypothetical protein
MRRERTKDPLVGLAVRVVFPGSDYDGLEGHCAGPAPLPKHLIVDLGGGRLVSLHRDRLRALDPGELPPATVPITRRGERAEGGAQ